MNSLSKEPACLSGWLFFDVQFSWGKGDVAYLSTPGYQDFTYQTGGRE
jgi:hypothetical protein